METLTAQTTKNENLFNEIKGLKSLVYHIETEDLPICENQQIVLATLKELIESKQNEYFKS